MISPFPPSSHLSCNPTTCCPTHLTHWKSGNSIFIKCLITCLVLILLPDCAIISRQPRLKPLSYENITAIISGIREQEKKVFSFYTIGTIFIKNWYWESEANVLIVGTQNPFRIKVEITHPWGQPILHILIKQGELQVLSFSENRLYHGDFTPQALSRFIPGGLNADLIWAALRGYPRPMKYHEVRSLKANQIILFDDKGNKMNIIDVYPESLLPKKVAYPGHSIKMAFSDFQENNGIYYPRKVRVDNIKGTSDLILNNTKMFFNKTIPTQIFILNKPSSFETIYSDDNHD